MGMLLIFYQTLDDKVSQSMKTRDGKKENRRKEKNIDKKIIQSMKQDKVDENIKELIEKSVLGYKGYKTVEQGTAIMKVFLENDRGSRVYMQV